ncbi:MAG: adenylosuccinate lyase, partial [Thermomicrobia bacterium]|nr:adenylosuccinate lyase [Thermomicrobia bacterium]MCA1725611.1 adenylosuccinate lyase [Thermomicrobia bacterium]
PAMGQIWSEGRRIDTMVRVEIAVCEAWAERGAIPAAAMETIRTASADPARVREIERRTDHDTTAFLWAMGETIGDAARYVHMGLTSSDVVDTTLSLLTVDALDLIREQLTAFEAAVTKQAVAHKMTLMIGRTHGVHAEPLTFGFVLAMWVDEIRRHRTRIEAARAQMAYGKISGAVGTHAHVPPEIEERACALLGLAPAPVSTQILQRDRHAQVIMALALLATSLEKFAIEIRHLQRTEVHEVEEPFGSKPQDVRGSGFEVRGESGSELRTPDEDLPVSLGAAVDQQGSSAMPHKRNPHKTERISGLARIVRSYSIAAMENVPLWHERDISNSAPERIIFPESFTLTDYMLRLFTRIMDELVVFPERMRENLESTHGLVASQRVLLALTEHGMARQDAYKVVQSGAMESWATGEPLQSILSRNAMVSELLPSDELATLFDHAYHLAHIETAFARLGIGKE